jgi:hypothetical protein
VNASYVHYQVKDHEVDPGEFKDVVQSFLALHYGFPAKYKQFILVCPSLSPRLHPVKTGLARYRDAKPFYADDSVLDPTKTEVDARLRRVGLDQDQIDFVHSHVTLDIGHGYLADDDQALEAFVARVQNHPDYKDKLRQAVEPAYAELLRALAARRGANLERAHVEEMLRRVIAAAAPRDGSEKAIVIWVHNWTRESFDIPADYIVDWSKSFDRTSRRVPAEVEWNTELIPELRSLRDTITAKRTERTLRFRGKCALSTGIAFGATFPEVGGWIFEIPQPPAKEAWRSDAEPTTPYELTTELINGDGADLVLGLNIRGDGREDIRRYVGTTGAFPRLFAFMGPPESPGSQAIRGAEDARAFARVAREQLGMLLKQHSIRHIRLFFYGPLALAVFLGQQL